MVSVICLEYSRKRQCGNGLCGDAFAASSKAQPFSGRRLHADLIRADAEYLPDSRTHGIAIRPDPGRLADYGEIHMTNAATPRDNRSEEHTSELQSLMRNSYAVFCLKQKKNNT